MQKATFTLEACAGESFDGYTDGQLWNGFACPYFPFESAQRITKILSSQQTAYYDESKDQFVFVVEGSEEEQDQFGAVEVEGIGKLYPVGARVWIWERI